MESEIRSAIKLVKEAFGLGVILVADRGFRRKDLLSWLKKELRTDFVIRIDWSEFNLAKKPDRSYATRMVSALALAAVASILPWNAASAETGVTNDEILIGSCYVFDQNISRYGVAHMEGAKAYILQTNDQGGVHGRKIRLVAYDDGDNSQLAIECFNHLISDGVFAGAFFTGSTPAVKHVALAESNKIPVIGWHVGADFLHEPFKRYAINARATFSDEASEMVDHLWNDVGVRKIGIIYEGDPLGVSVMSEVRAALKRHGAEPSAIGFYAGHSLDVDDAIRRVRGAHPEAVIVMGTPKPVAEVLKRSAAQGWHPIFLTNAKDPGLAIEAGAGGEGLVMTSVFPSVDSDYPLVLKYRAALAKYQPGAKPGPSSLEGFINAMILVEGLKRAGKGLTREKLIDAIESIHDWDIGLGKDFHLTFGPANHKAVRKVFFLVVRRGKVVPLKDWKSLKLISLIEGGK